MYIRTVTLHMSTGARVLAGRCLLWRGWIWMTSWRRFIMAMVRSVFTHIELSFDGDDVTYSTQQQVGRLRIKK